MTLLEDRHGEVLEQRGGLLHLRRNAGEAHRARLQVVAEENDLLACITQSSQ